VERISVTVLIKQLYNDAKASCASALKQSKRITLQWRKGTFTVMTNLMISSASWAAVWALLPDQGHGWWSLGHCMADEYLLQRCNPQALPKVMELTTCQVGASARLVSHWEANELRIVHISVVLEGPGIFNTNCVTFV